MALKTFNNIEIVILDGKVNYNYKGILYTKEEFEHNFLNLNPKKKIPDDDLATASDVGKLVCFYDNVNPLYYTYGILNEVIPTEDFSYIKEGDFSHWKYARRLTQEEIKELC